ncbi:hypothetical protein CCAX7_51060 [Capsulimonas corticalis]|uniref:Lipid-A-disaccharide synthase n=1 Tax=Capsulimonas corticalis TaxID=2219043 RepID=A0A402CPL7_9BACT|nr:hypothetical protein [Capsulimonas corticalis]BDI33055.1 hypothetical protein CCAX7_51060 [Capsulimonas corticalis]
MSERPITIAMIAGESSGDRQGAALLEALRKLVAPRPVTAWGGGGKLMAAAGVDVHYNSDPWSSIGIVATLFSIPYLLSVRAKLKRSLKANPPDALVLIDAGAFNVEIGRWAKQHGICPVFYYFPPGSWRRPEIPDAPSSKPNKLVSATDRIVTPFPWSADYLNAVGADAHFVGHPLLDIVKPQMTDGEFYERFGLDPMRPIVALLPGSRMFELTHILPPLIGAAGEISRRIPGVQFVLALAPSAPRAYVEEMIRREQRQGGRAARLQLFIHQAGDKLAQIAHSTLPSPSAQMATTEGMTLPAPEEESPAPRERPIPKQAPLVICEDLTYDVMSRSDLVITKSGTSTLEAAILHKPMIIVYRVSSFMAFEYRLRKPKLKIKHFGMPNIMADEALFPELLQDEANPEAISELAVGILLQPERLMSLKTRVTELVHRVLGEPGGVERSAQLLLDLIESHPRR